MKEYCFLILCAVLWAGDACAAKVKYPGGRQYIFRYYLHDKQGCGRSIDRPSQFLSPKAIERRKRQRLKVDSTDLPVSSRYIELLQTEKTEILGTSRWNNTVVVRSNDSLHLKLLASLPCVREARMVWQSPDSVEQKEDVRWNVREHFQRWDSVKYDPYGMSRPQVEMLGGERLHEIGLRGEGMTIAVLDGGFQSVDRIPCLQRTKIVGVHNFVPARNSKGTATDEHFFDGIDHGTKVLSVLSADAPEVILGTAPEACYWLLRCEDTETEMPVEEDYWAMAAEFADSLGADIITSSLGYTEYDNLPGYYHQYDLDGHTSFISRTASMLASKGIILVNSAGNSGMGPWKKITFPADAENTLTVGALNQQGVNAPFSGVGPTQDMRIKPDVMALGSPASLISGRGGVIRDMGTSFSTPIIAGLVACLWQALPNKTAMEIMDLVRQNSSNHEKPDNVYGYGTPNFWRAYMIGRANIEVKR